MRKPTESVEIPIEETHRRQPRKSTVWTKDKISQLIQLYRKHDCLWNHYTEAYKSKELRNKAIEDICTTLEITKFDFGKKIHNLRNQFNSEMKKLERRIEESGGNAIEVNNSGSSKRCRWEHFEALMFLRKVIEPRPGYQAIIPQCKKMRMKYDYNSDEDSEQLLVRSSEQNITAPTTESVTVYQFEDTANAVEEDTLAGQENIDDYAQYGTVAASKNDSIYDQKYKSNGLSMSQSLMSVTSTQGTSATTSLTTVQQLRQKQPQDESQLLGPITELPLSVSTTPKVEATNSHMLQNNSNNPKPTRDQWDAFGELIASEFRHLNSDVSRKKLKRKIMQAMLEVGDEDDSFTTNSSIVN